MPKVTCSRNSKENSAEEEKGVMLIVWHPLSQDLRNFGIILADFLAGNTVCQGHLSSPRWNAVAEMRGALL